MQNHSHLTVDHFFDPSSKEFVENTNDTLAKLREYPIGRYEAGQAG